VPRTVRSDLAYALAREGRYPAPSPTAGAATGPAPRPAAGPAPRPAARQTV